MSASLASLNDHCILEHLAASMAVHNSLTLLKQRVANARTYIRPIQKDLDLTPIEESIETVCYYLGVDACVTIH